MDKYFKQYRSGYSLPRDFYTSAEIYQQDLEKYWGHSWVWVGHISQLPEVGCYFVFEFGNESVIVCRDSTDTLKAHLNVCRHRGSRVCTNHSGKVKSFVCPYHAWTYNLDGELRSGRRMPEEFDRQDHGLKSVNLLNHQGLLFVCLSDDPPPLEQALATVASLTAPFQLEDLKIIQRRSYPVEANWKLALENYLECYHCAPSHREYSKSHSLKDPDSMTEELIETLKKRSQNIGLPTKQVSETGPQARALGADLYCRRYPLYSGFDTGSKDGSGVAPTLGLLQGYDGGATDLMIGPLNNFLIYADHMVAYRFIPTGVQTTEIQTVWLINSNATEEDYDTESLTWLWDVTTQDDERIIRHNQAGINSFHYEPGPLSTMEWGITDFYSGYMEVMRDS